MSDLNKILHVDDDDDILEIARMALEMVDSFTVHQCNNGPAALNEIAEAAPQLLLLDVMMPGMTGPDLWEQIKAMPDYASVPTIFMTAKAEDSLSQDLLKMGALAVITKPFDPMALGAQIRDAWATL
ncbi:response regulator [Rhodophyticola sp. CCM32]|uniref:response regulator n=1 Tax=Rhodophyticola sp. CCM32 TaxID=2916397 RepID=UPI00107FB3EC|nr:response regulator [Rhodophyticola sp. CCM32]QBY01791.1 response regulator [Rhodophyticola sp. CCM32]